MSIGRFLGGVAALIYDPARRRYLVMRRAANKDFLSGEWECVTGRVDQGESYTQAARREVEEETGSAAQIELLLGLTHFYRGPAQPENELLGVMFACTLADPQAVRLEGEHSEMRWLTRAEIHALLPAGHWLLRVIERAEWLRRGISPEMQARLVEEGFEF